MSYPSHGFPIFGMNSNPSTPTQPKKNRNGKPQFFQPWTSEVIDLDPAAVVAFRGAHVPPLSWMTSPADLLQRFPEHVPVLVTVQLEGTVGPKSKVAPTGSNP